jgi:hypothetical protein
VRLVRVCRRVDPPSNDVYLFTDRDKMNKIMDEQGGVWICKVYGFHRVRDLTDFINYMESKHSAKIF